MIEHVFLAGLQVPDARVLELARRLGAAGFDDLGDRLEDAWRREIKMFALEVTTGRRSCGCSRTVPTDSASSARCRSRSMCGVCARGSISPAAA